MRWCITVALLMGVMLGQSSFAQPTPGGGGGGTNSSGGSINTNRNYIKFMNQVFSLIDTNAVAQTDTNLYNALIAFPNTTDTNSTLQVASYGENSIVIKANHFNYLTETDRDFALLICDKVETPVWKNISLSDTTNSQDGWLAQGTVPNWKVTDPMYFKVSNIARDCNGFYRAIAYAGPQIELTGAQPYAVVSNVITLQVSIMDLSGVTNVQFAMNIDGLPARYNLGASNTISLNTKYNPEGLVNVYAEAFNNNARVYNPTNPPDKSKLFFSGITSLPLEFENDTYLLFASDNCSPDVGTNNILFVIDKAQQIEASITDPSNGQIVASYAGYVPYAATIAIPWNFTQADGVTPYSNDTYVVTFTAFDPTTLTFTNKIGRAGIRPGAGCFLTYQWEEPDATGLYLNNKAAQVIEQDLVNLFNDQYQSLSLTQYTPGIVGTNRNRAQCHPYTAYSLQFKEIMRGLTNVFYSELTVAQSHGSGATIGGGDYLHDFFDPQDLQSWCRGYPDHQKWRLRKAALWACYSGAVLMKEVAADYPNWSDACGIIPTAQQENGLMYKNCGLFFGGLLAQGNFGLNNNENKVTCEVAEFLDQTWVCGKNQYPGGCDPTYSFDFAARATVGRYSELTNALPILRGFKRCVYSSIYDDELRNLNVSHVKNN